MLPPVQSTFLQVHSLEEASQVLGPWADNNQQMDCGRLDLSCQVHASASAVLHNSSVSRSLLQRNATPVGWLCFGFVTRCSGGMMWNGVTIDESTLLVFQTNSSYESLSPAGFTCWTMSFSPELLALLAEKYEIQLPITTLGRSGDAVPISSLDRVEMTRLLGMIGMGDSYAQNEVMHELLPAKILSILSVGNRKKRLGKETARSRLLVRARDYMELHAHEALSMVDVSQASCASVRSLQRAFLESYNVSPHEYLRLVRLNRARRALTEMRPGDCSVSDVAMGCGFSHLGKFSSVYRKQFGELPRQTLVNRA